MPSDDPIITEDAGVTVSSPDTSTDVTEADGAESSMLDAVLAEVGPSSEPGAEDVDGPLVETPDPETAEGEQSKTPEGAQTPEAEKELDLKSDPTEEELKHYSQKANERIRNLVEQRNAATERAKVVEPILDFLQKNDIPGQDLDVMLDLTARLRHGDFAGFLKGVQPYLDLARQYTGQQLPRDLQQQVNQGYVSPEIARELAQRRAQGQFNQGRMQQQEAAIRQNQAQTRAQLVRQTVVDWERQTRASDPDYDLKADVVRRTAQALMQENGPPQTPEQALQVVKAAYEEVNGHMRRFRPQPKPTSRTPASTGQQGGSTPVAEPKSMMEAAVQALQASRG